MCADSTCNFKFYLRVVFSGWLAGPWGVAKGVAGCSYVQVSSIIRLESCSGGGLTGRTCCCSFLSLDPLRWAISRMFRSESVAVRVSGVTQACQPAIEWPILRSRKKIRHGKKWLDIHRFPLGWLARRERHRRLGAPTAIVAAAELELRNAIAAGLLLDIS